MIRSLFFIFCIALVSCSSEKTGEQSAMVASQIKLTDLEGKEVDLTEFEGKTIFVNFWATWCRPCIQEMPSIAALKTQLTGQNIEFFFASDEEVDKIQKFMESRKMTLNFVRVENPESLGIQALPTTFIFDGEGNLIFSEVGFRKWDDPETIEMVSKLINEE
ncbi:MAG: TlpA disulfide reductase family protein [Cyclobacteriaceae bacterium]